MVSHIKDITGIKFGSLTAIKLAYVKNRRTYWEYSCVCGKTHIARASTVTYEVTRIYPHIYSPDTCTWTTAKLNIAEATNRTNYGKRPNIKLSQEEVDEILHLYSSGEITNQSELARMYGVTPSAICRLIPLELNKRNKLI